MKNERLILEDRLLIEELLRQRKNYRKIVDLYHENFTKEVFARKCLGVIDEVVQ